MITRLDGDIPCRVWLVESVRARHSQNRQGLQFDSKIPGCSCFSVRRVGLHNSRQASGVAIVLYA